MMTPPLRILILADRRPGHVSTSTGMAELLADVMPCTVQRMDIQLRGKFLRPLLKRLVNSARIHRLSRLAHGLFWVKAFYRGFTATTADLVISTGGDTIYLNALLGQCRGRVNFFCGSLRGVDPALFSLILHTRESPLDNWLAMELLPSAIHIAQTAEAATAFADANLGGHRHGYWSVLIGGNGSGYRFDTADILAMLENIVELARQHGKQLLISSSRRTGEAAEQAITDWLAHHADAPVAYLVRYGLKPERVAGVFMHLAELVFCTEESTSMISEAVLNHRLVVAMSPAHARPVNDHRNFLEKLVNRRRIFRPPTRAIARLDLAALQARWHPYAGEDHRVLQARMLERLGRPLPSGEPT